jgi:hypothetical protein
LGDAFLQWLLLEITNHLGDITGYWGSISWVHYAGNVAVDRWTLVEDVSKTYSFLNLSVQPRLQTVFSPLFFLGKHPKTLEVNNPA